MRVRIDEGVYIDMVTYAGTESDDEVARRSNVQQVADFINTNSAGNAVIVFGDTNLLLRTISGFSPLKTVSDAWVQAIGGTAPAAGADAIVCPDGIPPNINCEVVDKVFYRGSPIISLKSSRFFYDTSRFLSPEGNTLTDHNPIRVEFGYNLASGLRQSDLYGGPHGTWFNDLPSIPSSPRLSSITLRGGNRLDGLTLTLEYVTSVKLCWGDKDGHTRNFYAQATTNQGKSVQAGKTTSDCATATAPSGYGVVGTYGQDGDQLGFIYARQ
ncbi:hypothetical protein FRC11_006481 [Ceratobasidium sp. 423]|nr:hypothetical protein FRC11_006481 [Ceratobasidium sp. 423]